MDKWVYLKYSPTDVPTAALTPDPKLSVVVGLTVRDPIPTRNRKKQLIYPVTNFLLMFMFLCL